MSQATLDALNLQKKNQIELSPFSEEFQIVGGDTFRGIFDDAHDMGSKDGGNVSQRSTCPAIMVAEIPLELANTIADPSKGKKINRKDGTSYTWRKSGTDKEGIEVIWLY